jgi:hypothetical protein
MNEVQSSADKKKYPLHREAHSIEVYNRLANAVEQVSVLMDALEAVE